jgi:D-amino-acid dehydrogenase
MKFDCMVIGAGMVGVGAALHLQQRGRSVLLVDRRGPAEETSYGNAGLIQTEGVMAYTFPRDLKKIIGYALNLYTESRLQYNALFEVAPWLWPYWRHGSVERAMQSARGLAPLIGQCLAEHESLIAESGSGALVRQNGYLKIYRRERDVAAAAKEQQFVLDTFGVPFERLDADGVAGLEPHLAPVAGGIHLTGPASVSDPSALGKAYADLFLSRGGRFEIADARSLEAIASGWRITGAEGVFEAKDAVIALGPWAKELLAGFGVRVPLGVKRGYHMHYSAKGNATLGRPVVDEDSGYVLAPMRQGIRLTTGAELARWDAPASPVHLGRVEPIARDLFPLDRRVQDDIWLGRRPCFPDMLPMIGAVPGRKGLWADFGHQHLGFTLGPVSGRLIAELVTGEDPFVDPKPYRVDRF